jgi:hypothetical protein
MTTVKLYKGDRVVFAYEGVVRMGYVENVKVTKAGKQLLVIKDDIRDGAFRSFRQDKIKGFAKV